MQEFKLFIKNVYLVFSTFQCRREKNTNSCAHPYNGMHGKTPLLRSIINATFVCNSGKNRSGQKITRQEKRRFIGYWPRMNTVTAKEISRFATHDRDVILSSTKYIMNIFVEERVR